MPTVLSQLSDELAALAESAVQSLLSIGAEEDASADAFGSGFVVGDGGLAVTNFHVIDGEKTLFATSRSGAPAPATVVGSDAMTDLALLRISALSDTPKLGLRQEPVRLGELAMALGSPLGRYRETATLGVVSGLSRTIENTGHGRPIEHALQTDAPINPGNSGGPLIDMGGEVIGVTTAGIIGADSLGFAIPADTVTSITSELLTYGVIKRAALGCSVAPVTFEHDKEATTRLRVLRVAENGKKSDVRVGDVLMSIEGHAVEHRADLYALLNRDRIGKKTHLEVLRDGSVVDLTITPDEL